MTAQIYLISSLLMRNLYFTVPLEQKKLSQKDWLPTQMFVTHTQQRYVTTRI